jgi:hypothetical protein
VLAGLANAGEALEDEARGLIHQLEDEGYALATPAGHLIEWSQLHRLLANGEYADAAALLRLPSTSGSSPKLVSRGSLTEPGFTISLDGWYDANRRPHRGARLDGGLLWTGDQPQLLSRPVWDLVQRVRRFAARDEADKAEVAQRRRWGEIRAAALAAGALLDDFLLKTVVITPERLRLNLRKSDAPGQKVVEVEPTFDGAPSDWIAAFDRGTRIPDRYDLATPNGIVQVLITPAVRNVLGEVKRLPGRRVAGARAEAFLINPIAALGESAAEVLDADEFEAIKEAAGIVFERFSAFVATDTAGWPDRIGLIVAPLRCSPEHDSTVVEMDDKEALEFTDRVAARLEANLQICAWRDFEFELDGDSTLECDKLREAVQRRGQPRVIVHYDEIYDLSVYSGRVEGIGPDAPYYSPYIARKSDDEGWVPANIAPVIGWTVEGSGETVTAPVTEARRSEIREKIENAKANGESTIQLDGFPQPIGVAEAERIFETIPRAAAAAAAEKLSPQSAGVGRRAGNVLTIKGNIGQADYVEARHKALSGLGKQPRLPAALKAEVPLKNHQAEGVAWLQHLFGLAPDACRGALLADDMGLGKTLQLLCLIAAAKEEDPALHPALVVAPLSLLENWKEEVERFFKPGALRLLTAYGAAMANLRVPRGAIDEQLREEGLIRFLKPGWRGDADIVLTTYETLRDLEFSFAREKWSIMVCDEAQKIKNPNAGMTKASKKQQVRFRVACTGTPVENSLTDLWCLFDFVQPGLLGALNDFGREYQRPIETKTENEKIRIEELRALIEPQILRRMKHDVAKDLPAKIIDENCRTLELSSHQRSLYADAIERYREGRNSDSQSASSNHLALLHHLRLLCTDPKRPGLDAFVPEPLDEYSAKAPKLKWVIDELRAIKAREEKVIIFCEFRNIQRLLRHYVEGVFGFAPDIINGDTSASAGHVASRQKRIRAFQERPGFGVIILSPVAVGFGVNIQAANHVIHYMRTWNPAKEDQASDRAYRIGQTKDVYVYYPTVRAEDFKTFDVRLDELLTRRRELAGDMLNGAGDVGGSDFDIDDIAPEEAGVLADAPITVDDVLRMNGRHFECFAAAFWLRKGFPYVELTPVSSDGGVDVVARDGSRGMLIQCKSSTTNHPLNWDAIKEVVGGKAFYEHRHPGTKFELVCMTNSTFNFYARAQAGLNGVKLVEMDQIAQTLGETGISFKDVEKFLG